MCGCLQTKGRTKTAEEHLLLPDLDPTAMAGTEKLGGGRGKDTWKMRP